MIEKTVLFQVRMLEGIYDANYGDIEDITAETENEYFYESKNGTAVYLNKADENVVWERVVHDLDIHSGVIGQETSL